MLRKPSARRALASYIDSQERVDIKVIMILFMLNVFGIIMIYSASSYNCSLSPKYNYDGMYFAKKQIFNVVLGFGVMLVIRLCNYNQLYIYRFSKSHLFKSIKALKNKKISLSWLIYIMSIVVTLTLFSPLKVAAKGAVRWIKIGPLSLQVAEVSKILIILWVAAMISKYINHRNKIRVLLFIWIPSMLSVLFLFKVSSNLSSAIIIGGIIFGMTFIMTPFWKIHIGVVAAGGVGVYYYINHLRNLIKLNVNPKDYSFRTRRFLGWLAPLKYADDESYQSLQALYAVASGGFAGKGLGNSVQKLSKIPEAQNDMIFAVICEELGILGAGILIMMFIYLIYQLFKIAGRAETVFGRAMVAGIAIHIALQVVVNIFVVLMIIPNTGVSLPFISYGGSAVVFTMAEMGLALAVDREHFKAKVKRKAKQIIEEKELAE